MDPVATADCYELVVERHHKTSTIITSNREPAEWIPLMADTLLAQSAVDRLSNELVVEGESYRRRQRPGTAHMEAEPVKGRACLALVGSSRALFGRVGPAGSVGDVRVRATRGQTHMRGLGTAGRAVRLGALPLV